MFRSMTHRLTILFCLVLPILADHHGPKHPLDALTADELNQAVDIMLAEGVLSENGRLSSLTLKEPAKADVLAWKEGEAFSRHAFAIVKDLEYVYEGVVDLNTGMVVDWKEVADVETGILFEEIFGITGVVLQDAEVVAALEARGLPDITLVNCNPLTVGNFGIESEKGRRLMKVSCFDMNGTLNTFGKPISGLYILVDLNTQEVLDVVDTGVVPIPDEHYEYNTERVGPYQKKLNPIKQIQYRGPSYTVKDHVVSWHNWKFHYRLDLDLRGLSVWVEPLGATPRPSRTRGRVGS